MVYSMLNGTKYSLLPFLVTRNDQVARVRKIELEHNITFRIQSFGT
jgi:hypothetical protein